MNRIDEIVGGRPNRKGIIHTVSYPRAREIMKRSKHRRRMRTHNTRSTEEAVAMFKQSRDPLVLVSPSVEQGFDFPLDECRFQIIAKLPFVNVYSPIVVARDKSGVWETGS